MNRALLIAILTVGLFAWGCKKEKQYIYEVNDVDINQPGSVKSTVKSSTEFISIAYADLFGTTISQVELTRIVTAYISFGDLQLIEDMIIKNFLNDAPVQIPSQTEMNTNVSQFVEDTYGKLLNREPNEYELWYMADLISSDASITPELIYYAVLTSDEYRYY